MMAEFSPRLMLITDRTLVPLSRLPAVVDAALDGGVDAVQLREKGLAQAELLAFGRELRAVTRGRARLIVNGSLAVARGCAADGLHLPEAAHLPPSDDRAGLLLGRSAHDAEGAARAEAEGADYLVLGTIFPSRSHPGGVSSGPALVKAVAARVSLPVIAVGGVTPANVANVLHAGACGVAVISAILAASDPRAAARSLRTVIDQIAMDRSVASR